MSMALQDNHKTQNIFIETTTIGKMYLFLPPQASHKTKLSTHGNKTQHTSTHENKTQYTSTHENKLNTEVHMKTKFSTKVHMENVHTFF